MNLGAFKIPPSIGVQRLLTQNIKCDKINIGQYNGKLHEYIVDGVFLPDNYEGKGIDGSSWVGVQLSAGVGVGAGFHVIEPKTVQTKSFNPIKGVKNLFDKIKGWLE